MAETCCQRRGTRRNARSWSRRGAAPTRRRCCDALRPACARSLATPWWCSAPPTTGGCTWWPTFAPAAVERGVKAGDVVRAAAEVAGGGEAAATRWRRPAAATLRSSPRPCQARSARSRRALRLMRDPRARPRVGPLRLRDLRPVRHACHAARRGGAAGHEARSRDARPARRGQGAERVVVGLPLTPERGRGRAGG